MYLCLSALAESSPGRCGTFVCYCWMMVRIDGCWNEDPGPLPWPRLLQSNIMSCPGVSWTDITRLKMSISEISMSLDQVCLLKLIQLTRADDVLLEVCEGKYLRAVRARISGPYLRTCWSDSWIIVLINSTSLNYSTY